MLPFLENRMGMRSFEWKNGTQREEDGRMTHSGEYSGLLLFATILPSLASQGENKGHCVVRREGMCSSTSCFEQILEMGMMTFRATLIGFGCVLVWFMQLNGITTE
ncbi:hypothetical protein CDAR_256811 [Caerostris darwini]|uniref:Uncharacterized protein n=1 Tax=Caerostris darwini TaxID=1538125 RepID=A0AAV4PYD7_9ARAC|nr:hypothetical protein CDAR_256811 [Caerostris darwini]